MPRNWTHTTLGAVVDFLSGGTPPRNEPAYWNGSIPWVSAKDMKRFWIHDTEDHVTEEGTRNGTRLVDTGTVFVLTRGMTLLHDVPICVARRPMTFNQDVKALHPRPGIRNDFLPYLLLGLKGTLLSSVDRAGHGTGRLNTDTLRRTNILLPPESEQHAIATILNALDEKIELNRQLNDTLETMASTLFQSWFVHFDPVRARQRKLPPAGMDAATAALFPDTFEQSELGSIPRGWRVGSILEIADILSGGTPNTTRADYWNGPIPWATAADVSRAGRLFLLTPRRSITQTGLENIGNTIVPAHATVVVARGATTGHLAMLGRDMAINQTCYAFHSRDETPCFLYFHLRHSLPRLTRAAHGSVFDTITTRTFKSTKLLLPDPRIRRAYETTVSPWIQLILNNTLENDRLLALRDTLLPRLLSGALRVRDAEKLVSRSV